MCKLVEISDGKHVAEIKYAFIKNIIEQAASCKNISRIVLFGSALEERCSVFSDIDIAVFGLQSKAKYLRSKEFKEFQKRLFVFGGDYTQDYDILYFCEDNKNDDAIMQDIENGTEIYRRKIA